MLLKHVNIFAHFYPICPELQLNFALFALKTGDEEDKYTNIFQILTGTQIICPYFLHNYKFSEEFAETPDCLATE